MTLPGEHPACPQRPLALEHALLGLSGPAATAFEAHLSACADCQATLAHALAESMESLEPAAPEPHVWARIQARMDAAGIHRRPDPRAEIQPWKRWTERVAEHPGSPGLAIHRSDAGAWQKTAIEGSEVQALSVSETPRQATMLVRMAPGSAYPAHRHAGPEECYVLSGDLRVGDALQLGPGDFQRAEAGSHHAPQSTRGGCLLLIQTSLDDELLA
jgi:anti-sigma factor ChrR (cupin superfamily)